MAKDKKKIIKKIQTSIESIKKIHTHKNKNLFKIKINKC